MQEIVSIREIILRNVDAEAGAQTRHLYCITGAISTCNALAFHVSKHEKQEIAKTSVVKCAWFNFDMLISNCQSIYLVNLL